jgi:hypothetical protein
MAQENRVRICGHAEHGRERQTFAAVLDRGRNALLFRMQMRIRVRLHAELGHEQHQRQHVNEQAMRSSGQGSGLLPRVSMVTPLTTIPVQVVKYDNFVTFA